MAVCYYNQMGEMTIKQKRKINGEWVDKKFKIEIWTSNCIACFNSPGKDPDTGEDCYYLYGFFADMQHIKNICKGHKDGKPFADPVTNIKLNLAYKQAEVLLRIFVKHGYKVQCYYKEPKKSKK